jgi:hypothetical protein
MNGKSARSPGPENKLDRDSSVGQDGPFVLRALVEEPGDHAVRWAVALSVLIKAGNDHGKVQNADAVRSVQSRLPRRAG